MKKSSIAEKLLAQAKRKMSDIQASKRQFLDLTIGDNLLRFLPWAEDELFYYEDRFHFIPWGGPTGRGIALSCTGDNCPGCSASEALLQSDDEEQAKTGQQISATSKYFYNVVDLGHPEKGVQVLANYSNDMLHDLLALYADPDVQEFFDPEKGRNIVVHKKDGKPVRYKTTAKVKPTAIQNKEWITQAKDLRKLGSRRDANELKRLLSEVVGDLDEGEEFTEQDKQDIIESLECFSKEYRKLDSCPTCPVKQECRSATKKRKVERATRKARSEMKKRVRRG